MQEKPPPAEGEGDEVPEVTEVGPKGSRNFKIPSLPMGFVGMAVVVVVGMAVVVVVVERNLNQLKTMYARVGKMNS